MAIEKRLDKTWYWLGYTCGANTRKEIKELPTCITNLGDRGIRKVPTETQKASFFIGLMVGRGKLVQNFNVVKVIQYQDKKARKKGDYLTLGMTEVKGNQGQTVNMPLIISNNTVDNRGFVGFQAKITYPKDNITFTTLTKANQSLTTLNYQHDAAAGVVLVQGLMDSVSYSDGVQVYLSFYVKPTCPSSQTITLNGPTGQGTGSDILTLISGENYYIQPIELEKGLIKLPDQQGHYTPTQPYTETIPSIGDGYDYYGGSGGGSTSFTYDFDMSLSYGGSISGGGSGGGSGASLGIRIIFGDGSSQVVYIPVQEGSHHYSGKIPITLPSMKQGPIKIEYWVEPEDEDDLYYWFIKAGALWGFETEIPREEVGDYEETQVDKPRTFVDFFKLHDFVVVVIEGYSPVVSDIQIGENFVLFDYASYIKNRNWLLEIMENMGITDSLVMDGAKVIVKDLSTHEIMQLLEGFNLQIIGDTRDNTAEIFNIGDDCIIEII